MSVDSPNAPHDPLRTPLYALHLELGARMVPFAGYSMPVQYPLGLMSEHLHTRQAAGLFDVSHMGQLRLTGPDAGAALESLVPMDVQDMAVGQQRYAFFTAPHGGLLDDLMITRRSNDWLLVVNAACKDADLLHLQTHIGHRCQIQSLPDLALLALQGPQAAAVIRRLGEAPTRLVFMTGCEATLAGIGCFVTRSGYTGEDGFEISVPAAQAEALARALLAEPEVRPVGLGARDTLRLEAGLCLYGHDIHGQTTPIEAALGWAIQKVRRAGGARAGGYPGADVIQAQFTSGPTNKRVGLIGLERVPVREGSVIFDAQGHKLGTVTSGSFAPTVNQSIAMAYLPMNHAIIGHEVFAQVRGKLYPMRVTTLSFVAPRYFRGH
jgi:aminomethyltransferase